MGTHDGQQIRLAILDDAPLWRQALTRLFRSSGVQITAVAADAAMLLEVLALEPCDVVVIDLHLHGMDGLLLIERIRLLHHEMRIIVLTADERPAVVHAALRAGADGYLVRRQQPEEIVDAVRVTCAGGTVIAPQVASGLVTGARGGVAALAEAMLESDELDVLRLVAGGATDLQIARELYVSPRTVQNQLARIRSKAGVRRRTELVRWATDNAIV